MEIEFPGEGSRKRKELRRRAPRRARAKLHQEQETIRNFGECIAPSRNRESRLLYAMPNNAPRPASRVSRQKPRVLLLQLFQSLPPPPPPSSSCTTAQNSHRFSARYPSPAKLTRVNTLANGEKLKGNIDSTPDHAKLVQPKLHTREPLLETNIC